MKPILLLLVLPLLFSCGAAGDRMPLGSQDAVPDAAADLAAADAAADVPALDVAPDAAPDRTAPPDGQSDPGLDPAAPDVPHFDFPPELLAQTVVWQECVLFDETGEGNAECADVLVPQDWADPSGPTMTVRVKRWLAWDPGTTRQLWTLQGGPGIAGTTTMPALWKRIRDADPTLDLYVVDHRGTGGSHKLECPDQEADDSMYGPYITEEEWPPCIEKLQADSPPLEVFTTNNAARDLGLVVELLKVPAKKTFVYGLSYGTFWVQRYGVLYPHQAEAIVLDSLLPPDGMELDIRDQTENEVTHKVFERCAEDSFCQGKLGASPWKYANDAFHDYQAGQCPGLSSAGIDYTTIQYLGNTLGMWYRHGQEMLPALYYRLARCDKDDQVAVYNAIMAILAPAQQAWLMTQRSLPLAQQIAVTELYRESVPPLSLDDIAVYEQDLVTTRYISYQGKDMLGKWPAMPEDEHWGEWLPPDVPVLVLQGGLDYLTPMAEAKTAKLNLLGPHQYFVALPLVRHAALIDSPLDKEGKKQCGLKIALAFLADPAAKPDASCADKILPLDFHGDADFTTKVMGTVDMWENAPLDLGCPMPDGYLDPASSSRLLFQFKGPILDFETDNMKLGQAEFDVMVDGEPFETDDFGAYVYQYDYWGKHLLLLNALGSFQTFSYTHQKYLFSRLTLSAEMLQQAMAAGQHVLAGGDFGGFAFEMEWIEQKQKGEDLFYKMCPVAVLEPDLWKSSLFVCWDGNDAFTAGETLKLAGNVALTDDPQAIEDALQVSGECYCWKNETTLLDCQDFNNL